MNEMRYEVIGGNTVRLFVPQEILDDDHLWPADERYVVGNDIKVTNCRAIGRSNDRFKYICSCGDGCIGGWRYKIVEVITINKELCMSNEMTTNVEGFSVKVHTLLNGASVIVTSPGHGFRFSDGTECGPQNKEICEALTLTRQEFHKFSICGMNVNKVSMTLDERQMKILSSLCLVAHIVLVPLPVLVALREAKVRIYFPNAVGMNSTVETQRLPPDKKIVDINNWSY